MERWPSRNDRRASTHRRPTRCQLSAGEGARGTDGGGWHGWVRGRGRAHGSGVAGAAVPMAAIGWLQGVAAWRRQ
eukprot:3716011-Prymnesium_polylepis.1